MKRVVAFLNGTYRREDLPFYRGLCRGRTTIAVDGGYRFFRAVGVFPDVLIGDFDSLGRVPQDLPESTEVLQFSPVKDETDSELAIDYCLKLGIGEVRLVMPGYGDIDHALGTILLLGLEGLRKGRGKAADVRVVNPRYEVRLVHDGKAVFAGGTGDVVSVLPIGERVVLTTAGMEYRVKWAVLRMGESRGLRNRITGERALVEVQGKALVVQLFSRGNRRGK